MKKFHTNGQQSMFQTERVVPGAFDDDAALRGIIADAIKRCSKKRETIATEMALLLHRQVTLRMLNAFTAEANECHRWPQCFTRAFCAVTGDDRLLRFQVECAGLSVINAEEMELLELGRKVLEGKLQQREVDAMADQIICRRAAK